MLPAFFRGAPLLALFLSVACSDDGPNSSSGASLDMSAGTSSTGSTGSTDSPTTGSTEGTDTSGDAPPICNPADDLEPNEIEDGAIVRPNITDEDGAGGLIESILAGDQDVDWFTYMGKDVALAVVDPAGDLSADMSIRLCLFVECTAGTTKPVECANSIYDESPDGRPGCCNSGESAFVSIDLFCDTNGADDESALVFMRVDQGKADLCVPYQIEYHF